MKRVLTLALAMLLACSSFFGCAKSGGTASSAVTSAAGSEASSAAASSAQKDLTPVTLKVWVMGVAGQVDSDKVWAHYNEQLKTLLPNTTVDFYIPKDYASEYSMALASNETIDLCWTGWVHQIPDEAKKGNILPLNKLLSTYGQGIIESLGEQAIENHRLSDGEIYQIPSYQGLIDGRRGITIPTALVNSMRSGWLDEIQKAQFEFADNYTLESQKKVLDLLTEFLKTMKDKGTLYAGISPENIFQYFVSPVCRTTTDNMDNGGWIIPWINNDSFTVYNIFSNGMLKQHAQYAADWYQKGYVRSDILTGTFDNNWNTTLNDNNYCVRASQFISSKEVRQKMESATYNMDVTIIEASDRWSACLGRATGMSIPFVSKNPERAMMLLNLMYTNKDLYRTWVYGIEGTHYTTNSDGSITLAGGSKGNTNPSSDWAYGQYNWTFGTALNSAVTTKDGVFEYSYCKKNEEGAYNCPILNFAFDPANVADEVTNCSSVMKAQRQQVTQGASGANWEQTYNTLESDMKKSGMDDVVADVQKQLTAYVKSKNITSFNWGK